MPISYPISKLSEYTYSSLRLDSSFIEVLVDEYGTGIYSNKKTTFSVFGDYLISSHPIFNKFDEIFNDHTVYDYNAQTDAIDYRYIGDMYFNGQTYFKENPKIAGVTSTNPKKNYADLADNQTVTKQQLSDFIDENGLRIAAIDSSADCYEFDHRMSNRYIWNKIDLTYNEISSSPISSTPFEINVVVDSQRNLYGTTWSCVTDSNAFLTVIGKVKVPYDIAKLKTSPYYTSEINLWAAVEILTGSDNNIATITELHNYKDGIAYFSMQLPMPIGKNFRIIVPFKPAEVSEEEQTDSNAFDIFYKLKPNTVCLLQYK